jgi:hypothetical protein
MLDRISLPDDRQRRADRHIFWGVVVAALISIAVGWL